MSEKSGSNTERIATLLATAAVTASVAGLMGNLLFDTFNNNLSKDDLAILVEKESLNCKYDSNKVNCTFLVTPLEDSEAYIDISGSRIIDNAGNVYIASSATIGNSIEAKRYAKIRLVKDVPIKMTMSFDEINQLGSKIALLEIDGRYFGNKPFDLIYQIKNIEILK